MFKNENKEMFEALIKDLLQDPQVQALAEMSQHGKNLSRLDHSLHVAYLSFLACRRLKLDYVAACRAALLHDFHFGDKDNGGFQRLWQHPYAALENAREICYLTPKEEDIIVKHMWPLTRALPSHKETVVVSMADKACALMEFSRISRLFKVKRHLKANPA